MPLSHLGDAIGWALLHSLWQGVLLAGALAAALSLLDRPASRYLAGVACLSAMLLAPGATVLIQQRSTAPAATAPPVAAPVRAAARFLPEPATTVIGLAPRAAARWRGARAELRAMLPWLTAAWAAGVLLLSLRLARDLHLTRRAVRRATPAPAAWQARLDALRRRQLGIGRRVRLLLSNAIDSPAVVGWLRPVILVPSAALFGLAPAQLEALLAHELGHVRRADYLVNLLQSVVETLLFYHPAVWWVSRQIRAEREVCCDDIAAAAGDPRTVARALLTLEEKRINPPALATAASGGDLMHRIRRLLDPTARRRSAPRLAPFLVAVTAIAVVGHAVSLELADAVAREEPAAPPVVSDPAEPPPPPAPPVPPPTRPVPVPAVAPTAPITPTPPTPPTPVRAPRPGEPVAAPHPHPHPVLAPAPAPEPPQPPTHSRQHSRLWTDEDGSPRMILDGSWSQIRSDDGTRLELESDGEIRIDLDRGEMLEIPDGRRVRLTVSDPSGRSEEMSIEQTPSGRRHSVTVDGVSRPFDATAERWLAAALDVYRGRARKSMLEGERSALRGQISAIRGQRSAMRGQISALRGQRSAMRGQISAARGQVSALRGKVSAIRGQRAAVRGQLSSLRAAEQQQRRQNGPEAAARADALAAETAALERQLEDDGWQREIADVERAIGELSAPGRVATLERQLEALGADAGVAGVEAEIAATDFDGKVAAIERQIEAADFERRLGAIEREQLEPAWNGLDRARSALR